MPFTLFRQWTRHATIALAAFVCAAASFGFSARAQAAQAEAIFAGGCFWCMEKPFDQIEGVISTTSGYIGGTTKNPTYPQVSSGSTGHTEAVRVVYDPAKVSYDKLVHVFWRNIDPLVQNRQFCDTGTQYRSGIFVIGDEQKSAAEKSFKEIETRFAPRRIYTEITKAGMFYPAEDYHQDYYLKNPTKYNFYRWNCGRDQRLKEIWGEEAEH